MTVYDSLHSLVDHERLLFHWRITNDESLLIYWTPFLSLSLILWPTVSRPVCLGIKHLSGANDQIFITVRQLRVCWCGALSLTRGRVCRLQLLLVLASAVIHVRVPWDSRPYFTVSDSRISFLSPPTTRRATVRYLAPPSHGMINSLMDESRLCITSRRPEYRSASQTVPLLFCVSRCSGN
jgi:hypothetical protein